MKAGYSFLNNSPWAQSCSLEATDALLCVGSGPWCDRRHRSMALQGATVEAEARKVPYKSWVLQGPRHQEATQHWCRQRPVERDFTDPAGGEFWPAEPMQVWRLPSGSDSGIHSHADKWGLHLSPGFGFNSQAYLQAGK